MIDARGIRLGNWVNTDQGLGIVTSMDRTNHPEFKIGVWVYPLQNCQLLNAIISPILLTAEWLGRMGIKQNLTKNAWWDSDEKILLAESDGKFYLGEWAGTSDEPEIIERIEIKYVHQLQNLFFELCGEEVGVTL